MNPIAAAVGLSVLGVVIGVIFRGVAGAVEAGDCLDALPQAPAAPHGGPGGGRATHRFARRRAPGLPRGELLKRALGRLEYHRRRWRPVALREAASRPGRHLMLGARHGETWGRGRAGASP